MSRHRSTLKKNKKNFILILFSLILMLSPLINLSAHPHMFIDMKLKPVFTDGSFSGMYVNWLFDMVFTGSVLMDNGIGWKESFTNEEIEIIKNTSFINLINYNYFTYFNAGGKIHRAKSFSSFKAFMSENRLGYDFFLPYQGPNKDASEIRIAVYDETFFCDIAFTEYAPVDIESSEELEISWELSRKYDAPIFYDNTAQRISREGVEYTGQAFPVELVLTVER